MRKIFNTILDKYRVRDGAWGSDSSYGYMGTFNIRIKDSILYVISSGSEKYKGWEHVSVSLKNRCPTWEEMRYIKNLFWGEEETVIQFHPPKSKYKNKHPYCLHLWKSPQSIELPPEETITI